MTGLDAVTAAPGPEHARRRAASHITCECGRQQRSSVRWAIRPKAGAHEAGGHALRERNGRPRGPDGPARLSWPRLARCVGRLHQDGRRALGRALHCNFHSRSGCECTRNVTISSADNVTGAHNAPRHHRTTPGPRDPYHHATTSLPPRYHHATTSLPPRYHQALATPWPLFLPRLHYTCTRLH